MSTTTNTQTAQHTPGPWKVEMDDQVITTQAENDEEGLICDTGGNRANAHHIVKCVNLHPELLEALESFCEAVKTRTFGDIKSSVDQKTFDAYCLAQQAILKAKG